MAPADGADGADGAFLMDNWSVAEIGAANLQ
jgi:hypothetical protein